MVAWSEKSKPKGMRSGAALGKGEEEWGYGVESKKKKNQNRERGAAWLSGCRGEKKCFWFRVFCGFSTLYKIAPPQKNQFSMVFIGKLLLGFQTSPSIFPFLLFSSFFL